MAKNRPDRSTTPEETEHEIDPAAETAFIESLIATGQAAKTDAQGRLPPGATHEIVEAQDGQVKVVRRRFSAY